MATELFLVQRFPDGPRHEWALQPGQQVIGRSSGCEIGILDNTISREHAKILVEEEAVRVVDLNSRNGTYLNGVRIESEAVPLGALVQFGRIECVLADAQMLQEFADSARSTLRFERKNPVNVRERLSNAQKPVFDGLLEGLGEKEIALRLDLSPNTIKHHIGAIYRRLEVSSHLELMSLYAYQ
jgi:DNA-binding CsgD family transcriptional regulator